MIERFSNPRIGDQVARICSDGSAKMPKFLIPSMREALDAGRPHRWLTLASASFDVFTGDLVRALCSGGTLVLGDVGLQLDIPEWAALIVRRRLRLAGLLVCAWGGAVLLYPLIKYLVHRPRPPAAIWLTNVGHTTSFPSGHATQSLATYLALALVLAAWLAKPNWATRAPALALAAGIGASRVYLGVHWTTDVLAGWLIATAWFASVVWLTTRCPGIRSES